MRRDALGGGGGNNATWPTIGTTYEGVIVEDGDWRDMTNQFSGLVEKKAVMNIRIDDGTQVAIWYAYNRGIAQAIAAALDEAGLEATAVGQRLKLQYVGDQAVGKGNPMKMYRAKITPGDIGAPAYAAGGYNPDEPF
jgi:hypothetical protein